MAAKSATFPRACRLTHDREFEAVYRRGLRSRSGPVQVAALPNGLGRHRLGLSIPKRVGSAPVRNRLKRLLREAFRTQRHELALVVRAGEGAQGLDLVISAQPHELWTLDRYARVLRERTEELAGAWQRRGEGGR